MEWITGNPCYQAQSPLKGDGTHIDALPGFACPSTLVRPLYRLICFPAPSFTLSRRCGWDVVIGYALRCLDRQQTHNGRDKLAESTAPCFQHTASTEQHPLPASFHPNPTSSPCCLTAHVLDLSSPALLSSTPGRATRSLSASSYTAETSPAILPRLSQRLWTSRRPLSS